MAENDGGHAFVNKEQERVFMETSDAFWEEIEAVASEHDLYLAAGVLGMVVIRCFAEVPEHDDRSADFYSWLGMVRGHVLKLWNQQRH